MKAIEPSEYLSKIKNRLKIVPIYDLDLSSVAGISDEIDKRVKIAESFIPEIDKIGPYDPRWDIAIALVSCLSSSKKEIQDRVIIHYGIRPAIPWTFEVIEDVVWHKGLWYHPISPCLMFSPRQMPRSRLDDIRELVLALQLFKGKKIPWNLVFFLQRYYGFKSTSFSITPNEIELIEKAIPRYPHHVEELLVLLGAAVSGRAVIGTLPHLPRRLEELNALLAWLYESGNVKEGTILGNLLVKMERSYKTFKKYFDKLRLEKILRLVAWMDKRMFGLQSVAFFYPVLSGRIKRPYAHTTHELYGNASLVCDSFSVPQEQMDALYHYVKLKLKAPIEMYYVYQLPLVHYNFKHYSFQGKKFVIDWNAASRHFKECKLEEDDRKFVPLKPPMINYDEITLKIADLISGIANLTDTYIADLLGVNIKTVSTKRAEVEKYTLSFPYLYISGCPELYVLIVKAKNYGEIDYCLEFFSEFPFNYYAWLQNYKDESDTRLMAHINLPLGSFQLVRLIYEHFKLCDFKIYMIKTRSYGAISLYGEMYDKARGKLHLDFSKILIT